MGYLTSSIADDADVLYRARFNWTYDACSWFWLALGAVPAVILHVYVGEPIEIDEGLGWAARLSAAGLALGAFNWLTRSVRKWTTVIAITSRWLVYKTGLIARTAHETNLHNIEEVTLRRSFWGKLFGYGSLVVRGEGLAVLELPPIARPVQFRQALEDAMIRIKHGYDHATKDASPA